MWNTPSKSRLDQIPRLYETESIPAKDKLMYLHFYIFGCDWFVCEWDRIDRFFGYVILNEDSINAEWGYFSFSELKSIKINSVEVCCEPEETWCPKSASEIKKIRL